MSEAIQPALLSDLHLKGFERRECDGCVEILLRGCAVFGYSINDPVGRDFVVATLSRELKGITVAKLCGVSPSHVTKVKQRVAAGGYEALAVRGKRGARRKLTGRKLTKMRQLRKRGLSINKIALELGVHWTTVKNALDRLGIESAPQPHPPLPYIGDASGPTHELKISAVGDEDSGSDDSNGELQPGAELPTGPTEHPSRYAGTLLLAVAMEKLGVAQALDAANAKRRITAVYDACQMVVALACAWIAGFKSLESMHERDARGLGVVLGLQRSPSVRTAHRAIADMVKRFDPIALGLSLMKGLRNAGRDQPLLFGIDGHFKEYTGPAPIDKGWNAHKRMATKGLGQVMVHDALGATWLTIPTGAGDALSQHVVAAARQLRCVHGPDAPIVLGFDRGGFCFETLRTLDAEGFGYLAWVPSTAKTPSLASIAPTEDGVDAVSWDHDQLGHAARLIVQRDGDALLPAVTNLSDEVEPTEALEMLRLVRGVEENSIKAARASVHIDQLVDRGIADERADDRLVPNPSRGPLRTRKKELAARIAVLEEQQPLSNDGVSSTRMLAELEEAIIHEELRTTPAKLPRVDLDPDARRAWLRTNNRALLLPLKLAADNARRWLLAQLGEALAPTDCGYDATAMPRTLMALLRAPGTVRFDHKEVLVSLDLPLPPTAHGRIDEALRSLSKLDLLFPDKHGRASRNVRFRLASRPTRATLPHRA